MRGTLALIFVIVTRTVAQVCDYEDSVELTNRTYNNIKYEDGEYFVDNTTGVERGCVCMKETCMRKCCPIGQAYDMDKRECVDFLEEFNPPVREGFKVKPGFNASKEFYFLINKMNCSREKNEYRIDVGGATPDYHLKTDGKLYVTMEKNIPSHFIYGPDKYCVDTFLTENKEYMNKSINFNGLICFVYVREENHYVLNATCMIISCFFILLTVAVYGFLPKLRTLHGMVMTAYLLSFFVAFLFLAAMQIMLVIENINQAWCTSMTFVIYFSMLAAFFWLNVMCYDLWSKLRTSNMTHGFSNSKRVRFLLYSAYAFGVPAMLTVVLAALEFSGLPANIELLPHLRLKGCFIYGVSKLFYLYLPIILICVANLVFFILTARKIMQTKRQTQVLKKKDTQRFSLYIKLFIVTGVNWILEVISAIYPKVPYLWHFTDAYNILVGLIIFIMFVCKKKILMAIKKRYRELMGLPQSRTNLNTTTTSQVQSSTDIQMQSNASLETTVDNK